MALFFILNRLCIIPISGFEFPFSHPDVANFAHISFVDHITATTFPGMGQVDLSQQFHFVAVDSGFGFIVLM